MSADISFDPIAALTLARYPWRNAYSALVGMGLNRILLRRVAGLRFWKLLGSARGLAFGAWNPRRYGLFTVWDSPAALDAFERDSPLVAAYRRRSDELWTVRLKPISWHGTWGGVNPFANIEPAAPLAPDVGPLAILTRATIRPLRVGAFRAAARQVNDELAQRPGLLAAIGLGEAPLFIQATFSLWASPRAVRGFAYSSPEHIAAMGRKDSEDWYSEELFARFKPIESYGTWDGGDPLESIEN
ncbi:MAG: spheroidene monooxygenase [Roseiflexaceae bacterium]